MNIFTRLCVVVSSLLFFMMSLSLILYFSTANTSHGVEKNEIINATSNSKNHNLNIQNGEYNQNDICDLLLSNATSEGKLKYDCCKQVSEVDGNTSNFEQLMVHFNKSFKDCIKKMNAAQPESSSKDSYSEEDTIKIGGSAEKFDGFTESSAEKKRNRTFLGDLGMDFSFSLR